MYERPLGDGAKTREAATSRGQMVVLADPGSIIKKATSPEDTGPPRDEGPGQVCGDIKVEWPCGDLGALKGAR